MILHTTRGDLAEMTHYPTFLQRIGYHWICVAPATVLCAEYLPEEDTEEPICSLREEASKDGLCFLSVHRYIPSAELYVARVANDPEKVKEQLFSIFLSEEQLRAALSWDCRPQGKNPAKILTTLFEHERAIQPLRPIPEQPQQALHPASIVPLKLCE